MDASIQKGMTDSNWYFTVISIIWRIWVIEKNTLSENEEQKKIIIQSQIELEIVLFFNFEYF